MVVNENIFMQKGQIYKYSGRLIVVTDEPAELFRAIEGAKLK